MERVAGQVVRCVRDVGGVKVVDGYCGVVWDSIIVIAV